MSSAAENETEILLGNKQLLVIFFVIALLLGVAFTGGYMVGKNSTEKKLAAATSVDAASSSQTNPSALETHAVQPVPAADSSPQAEPPAAAAPHQADADSGPAANAAAAPPLGSPKHGSAPKAAVEEPVAPDSYAPQSGQTFLQVAAVGRNEADGMADVLNKKGFHAHSVQKPGSELYRVLVGPIRDTGELSSTRDALRNNAGFTKIIVQRY